MHRAIGRKILVTVSAILVLALILMGGQAQAVSIKDCNGKDITDHSACKKAYNKCSGSKSKVAKCRKDAIAKYTKKKPQPSGSYSLGSNKGPNFCGADDADRKIYTTIDFGCSHKGNALLDLSFAIIRFLSNGAGLVIVGSLVWGGIQYTLSRGDPQATASAINRLRSALIALFIFIFAYALLVYLIPGLVLQ